jgi:hypothetical protein
MAERQGELLPETLRAWASEQAAASGEDVDDVVSRAVMLYRLVDEHPAPSTGDRSPIDAVDERFVTLDGRLTHLDESVATLDGRVATVEDDLDEKITDVRERVVQVKREVDGKAAADHGHADLREHVERTEAAAVEANERAAELEAHVDRGFENHEEIVAHLTDELDEIDRKLTRLASAVVDLRRRTTEAEHGLAGLDAVAELKSTANRVGETTAKCGECTDRVAIGLLTEPNCPHCDARFVDVEPAGRFFGSATLITERAPALTAGARPDDPEREEHDGRGGRSGADPPATAVTELFTETSRE